MCYQVAHIVSGTSPRLPQQSRRETRAFLLIFQQGAISRLFIAGPPSKHTNATTSVLEKANQLLRRQHELKARMSATMRYRSDSVVSIDEPALQLGLNREAVMEEAVLEMLQTNNVEELRKVDADALALATTAKTYALHEACEAGSMDVVRFLLEEAEHDIDIRDAQQWTPLHYAAAFQGDKPELVHYLLSKGADARAPGLYGELVKAERPKYVEAEVRLAFGVLHAQANTHYDRIKESGVSAEAFILGAHGGHVCFDHVL